MFLSLLIHKINEMKQRKNKEKTVLDLKKKHSYSKTLHALP